MLPKEWAVIDCETIPNPNIPEECRPQFKEEDVALGNLKDPFKINEKIEQARQKFDAQVDKEMATNPDLCMVCCGAIALYDGTRLDQSHTFIARDGKEEDELIVKLWSWIRAAYQTYAPIVGFNSLSFDLPVLVRRAMLLDIGVAPDMIANLSKRESRHHYDLMQMLALRSPFSGKPEVRGLDYYLRLFGLGAKHGGIDGSMVFPMWKEGMFNEIAEYCKEDVLKTADLFKRIAPWMVFEREVPAEQKKEKAV